MGIREFGAFLRQQREAMGLSQGQVAKAADIDQSYVSRLERGDAAYKSVGVIVLKSLAGALNSTELELDALLYDRPLPRPAALVPEITREVPVMAYASIVTKSNRRIEGFVYVPFSEMRGRQLIAVVVPSECLAPHVPVGATVILDETAAARVRDGQIVAATLLDTGEQVMKRFFQMGDKVKLQPTTGQPIIVDADRVRIVGVAIEMRQRL